MKKIISYFLILIPLICYLFASYNFEKIKQFDNMLDLYFLENSPNEKVLEGYLEQNNNIIDIVGISSNSFTNVTEKNYNRTENSKLLKIFGNPEKIFNKEDIIYKSYFEPNGAYISDTLAYSIFKNNNIIGNKIFINNTEYVICGVFKNKIPITIIKGDEKDKFNNIKVFFNYSDNIIMNINNFIRINNNENTYINNINSKINILYFLLQIPKLLILILITIIFYKVFNFKNKFNLKNIIYQILAIIVIILFYFMLNINLKVPLNFIPNKWSDFSFYKNLFIDFYFNFKNYIQIDKSLLFINVDKNFILSLIFIILCIISIIIYFKKKASKL